MEVEVDPERRGVTFPTAVRETPEHIHHIEAQEREIEAKEEIIRLQADEIAELRGLLGHRQFPGGAAYPA